MAHPFGRDALPEQLASRYVSSDGRELVEITPAEDVSDNAAARRFIAAVRGVVAESDRPAGRLSRGVEHGRARVRARAVVRVLDSQRNHLPGPAALAGSVARDPADRAFQARDRGRRRRDRHAVQLRQHHRAADARRLRSRQRHPCRASDAYGNGRAALRHERDAGSARERPHDRRNVRHSRVLVARRHREHGSDAGDRSLRQHGVHADRVAGVVEGARRACAAAARA